MFCEYTYVTKFVIVEYRSTYKTGTNTWDIYIIYIIYTLTYIIYNIYNQKKTETEHTHIYIIYNKTNTQHKTL